jgi:hypothetical protein
MEIYEIEKAVDNYSNKMSKEELITYVRWNMKDYYVNVADEDEGEEFVKTNRDTSVCIEGWE